MDADVSAMTGGSLGSLRSHSEHIFSDDGSFSLSEGTHQSILYNVLLGNFFTVFIAELELVDATNDLLREIGAFPKLITSFDELKTVASSMFVAIFENIFQVRLDGITRAPESYADYVNNVQRVIDELSRSAGSQLSCPYAYVTSPFLKCLPSARH